MSTSTGPDDDRAALLEAAIRQHYSDPDGRRILAERGIPLPTINDGAAGMEVGAA